MEYTTSSMSFYDLVMSWWTAINIDNCTESDLPLLFNPKMHVGNIVVTFYYHYTHMHILVLLSL